MSKGSTPRPIQVSNEEYAQRWDLIFGRDKPEAESTEKETKETEDEDLNLA